LSPDLAIIDVVLPGMRGPELARRLRRFSNIPIIFLTAAASEADQLEGFASGGNDYVLKPFLPHVLKARIRSHLDKKQSKGPSMISIGSLEVDLSSRSVVVAGNSVELTRYEYGVLACLLENLNKVVNKSELMEAVWEGEWGDGHAVENTLSRLRSKLKQAGAPSSLISTQRGLGYRISTNPTE
jgi:DNA-binding response OmpR family regulator